MHLPFYQIAWLWMSSYWELSMAQQSQVKGNTHLKKDPSNRVAQAFPAGYPQQSQFFN